MKPTEQQTQEWARLISGPQFHVSKDDDRIKALLLNAMRTPECPQCVRPVSQIDAAPDGWDLGQEISPDLYFCPYCRQQLSYFQPVMGTWHWLKKDTTPK